MATKFCTNCGAKLRDNAKFCVSCGKKVSDTPETSEKLSETTSVMNAHFDCPNCGSENVQNLPIIFQSGTSGSNSITETGKIISVTRGSNMTNLARSVAPPRQKEYSWWLTALLAFLLFIFWDSGETWLILLLLFGTVAQFKDNFDKKNYNDKVWPAKYDTWLHSYLCHRCGNVFVVR